MNPVYYNEHDSFAAAWLKNLIAAGHLPAGDVDERDIQAVSPDDLKGYGAAHFFAGIGGWPLALRMAGIPDDAQIWTGSCPCQPFSAAGKQKGKKDERHLWPVFSRLIAARRPEYVFGEQVSEAITHGWVDDLSAEMEAEGYAVGYVVLGAHSLGAPHKRQRLYWGGRLADPSGERFRRRRNAFANRRKSPKFKGLCQVSAADVGNFWRSAEDAVCADNKKRFFEPEIFPLAHGFPCRLGIIRGAGNAVVPQVAEAFVKAFMECMR